MIEEKNNYIDKTVQEIKNAKTDKEIKDILLGIYVNTQMDSYIRKQFDDYYNNIIKF